MAAEGKNMSFEDAIARLEAVVKELEDGGLPLEKALELFAEGIELSKVCNKSLEAAEQRIAILTRDESGGVTLKEIDRLPAGGEGAGCDF
ncbi:exodeoxyribonuclease VII small subunit [Pelotomaculum propionicicum]|uniref:Exodeoxyribonuclease 7 small subunit n=1 Tax=Pelotomaculum propionicicum TaxID=258475 RepID=A0A4Y7RMZ3_9FIRM|nr:exodeoxyribonuclease VII small subunit [Pelotomaculum propionicicum]NLI12396.1 exodeoxyribonuclease VII small subunit [Peptococcaceae bacterium]TEB10042.1 Exodeoxyribonuclease 7 small subunit [Pelotomaculum propionicicum]